MESFAELRIACADVGWPAPLIRQQTGSTNADARQLDLDGAVVVALEQTAGRGRLGRTWVSAPGDGLTFSIRRELAGPADRAIGWVPLLAGVAVAQAISARVKWPNDLLLDGGKVGGILSERTDDAVVVGIGVNLRFRGEPPDPQAVALGGGIEADPLAAIIVRRFAMWWDRWLGAGADAARCGLIDAYRDLCVNLNRDVTVIESGQTWIGHARDVDTEGRLVVVRDGRDVAVSAADISVR